MTKIKVLIILLILVCFVMPISAFADDPTTTVVTTPIVTTIAPTTLPPAPELDDPLPSDTTPPVSVPSKEDLIAKKKAETANKNLDKASQKLLDTQLKIEQTTLAIQDSVASLAAINDKIDVNTAILAVNELPTAQLQKEIQYRAIKLYQDSSGVPTDALARFYHARVVSLADSVQSSSSKVFSIYRKKVDELSTIKNELDTQQSQATNFQAQLTAQNVQLAIDFDSAKKEYEKQSITFLNAAGSVSGRLAIEGKMCPIAGPMTHVDDWGNARSGGRTHKGNDLFSAQGTPNVAIVKGRAERTTGGLGGNGVFLYGDDGNAYYYAHLLTWAGDFPRNVEQGEVIGYTGASGNADGGAPHTHFEIRIGNTLHTNPYPVIRIICGV